MTRPERWSGWVYDEGDEPDYRFSLANERTFLAWIRTSMAMLAGAVVLDTIKPGSTSETLQTVLSVTLLLLGVSCALVAWVRWARVERAMGRREPLPSSSHRVARARARAFRRPAGGAGDLVSPSNDRHSLSVR